MPTRFLKPTTRQRRKIETDVGQIDAIYALSESSRQDEFDKSVYQQQQEYADEENAQWNGERQRVREFDDTLASFRSAFDGSIQRREHAYVEAQAKQDDDFRANEEVRDAIFSESQSSRASSFQHAQDTQSKRSEQYSATRDDHFRKGRFMRKAICDELEKVLVEQFNNFSRAQEESFASNERRRDDTVNKLVEEEAELRRLLPNVDYTTGIVDGHGPNPEINYGERPIVNPEQPHEIDDSQEPERPQPDAYSSASTQEELDTGEPSSRPISLPGLPSSAFPSEGSSNWVISSNDEEEGNLPRRSSPMQLSPDGLLNGILLPPESHGGHTDQSAWFNAGPETEVRQINDGTQATKVADIQEPTRHEGEMPDARFEAALEVRQRIFSSEEEKRETRFKENEAARDKAEASRSELFIVGERARKARHHTMMVAHKELFDERQAKRMLPEIMRHEKHEASQARRYQIFENALLVIRNQFEAANSLEDKIMGFMIHATEGLEEKQGVLLSEARARILFRFDESQYNRERLLRYIGKSPPWGLCRLELCPTPLIEEQPAPYPRSRKSFHSPESSPIFQAISPAIGFAATALFRGENISAALPTSRAHHRDWRSSNAHDPERRRQYIFNQSQTQRQAAFENGKQRRRQIFNFNEIRRQLDFEAEQRERKATYEDKEDSRESDFQEAQKKRESRFWQEERKRASVAASEEAKRDDEFQTAQWKREMKFHSEQEKLMKRCFENEDDRQEKFADSELNFFNRLEDRKENEPALFKESEDRREATFQTSLEGSPLMRRIMKMRDAQALSKEETQLHVI
ncbi:hypothetical protein Hypma_010777 [Hypsizygus marmoreus]|uniref:Uncharacterized protein n=1 Tax=Hypsizygus marmoreus TaxID=39966 RepID=A0A369JLC0_HYPMA|nr:hypothetical protein Hypma_010777 [Hypsizygus marmoreus]